MKKVIFFGTPEIAVPFLEAFASSADFKVIGVITQPDKPVGPKKILTASPCKKTAETLRIPVFGFASLKSAETQESIRSLNADIFVIVAYGKIIPQAILDLPALGSVNMHPSKLPLWRGPSPLQAVLLAGESESAVSIMLIDDKMDHGPLLAQLPFSVPENATPLTLTKIVQEIGPPLMLDAVKSYIDGAITPKPQNDAEATYCSLISREDGKIDWQNSSEQIERRLRAFTPWPGIWCLWNGKRVKIHQLTISDKKLDPGIIAIENSALYVGTSTMALQITSLQPEGKAAMTAESFINGYKQELENTRFE